MLDWISATIRSASPVPCQAGQQVAAPDFQLRFARLPGTGYAVGGEQGCSPIVTKVERRPGGAEHHPGLDTGSCHGRDAGRRGQELACFAVSAGGDPPAGEQGGQLPPRVRLLATERPGQRGADVGLFGGSRSKKPVHSRSTGLPPPTGPPSAPTAAGGRVPRFPRRRRQAGRRRTGGVIWHTSQRGMARSFGGNRDAGVAPAVTCRL